MSSRRPRREDNLEFALLDSLGVSDRWLSVPSCVYRARERYGLNASAGEVAHMLAELCRRGLCRRSAISGGRARYRITAKGKSAKREA